MGDGIKSRLQAMVDFEVMQKLTDMWNQAKAKAEYDLSFSEFLNKWIKGQLWPSKNKTV